MAERAGRRWPRTVALVVAGVVLVATAAAVWLFATDGGRERLRRLVLAAAERGLEGKLEIAALRGGPLSWRIEGVRVLDPEGGEVFAADAIEVTLAPSLALDVERARIERPRIRLAHLADGRLNALAVAKEVPAGLPLDERPAPVRFRVRALAVEGGELTYVPPAAERAGLDGIRGLSDLRGEVSFDAADGLGHVRVGWLGAVLRDGPVVRLSGEVTFGKRLIDLARLELQVGDSVLEVRGRYERPEGAASHVELEIQRGIVAVAELVRWAPGTRLAEGVVVRGKASGTPASLSARVDVFAGPAGQGSVEGTVALAGTPVYDLVVRGSAIDLNAWSDALPPTALSVDASLRGERFLPSRTTGRWDVRVRGSVGGVESGEVLLPLVFDAGHVTFDGASWAKAALTAVKGRFHEGALELVTGPETFRALAMDLFDVDGLPRWTYRLGGGAPERRLEWRPGEGWTSTVAGR